MKRLKLLANCNLSLLIHQRDLLPMQCFFSDITNSKLSKANYTWISFQLPFCFLWWHWLFKKMHSSSIGLDIRPQRSLTVFRALLPSANNSSVESGRVWQPDVDRNVEMVIWPIFILI
jgi:hypothetical protein